MIQLKITRLCSLCGGPKATYVCHICNCPSTLLEEPCTAMTLEDTRHRKCKGEFHTIHSLWLMPWQSNWIVQWNLERWWRWDIIPAMKIFSMIWHFVIHWELAFSTPPEALHAILLCHGTHLSNAFARLETEREEKEWLRGRGKGTWQRKWRSGRKFNRKEKEKEYCFYWRFWKTHCNWIVRSWVLAGKAVRSWQDKTQFHSR